VRRIEVVTGWKSATRPPNARGMVAGWDRQLTKDSVPAAIHITWRKGSTGQQEQRTSWRRTQSSSEAGLDTLTWISAPTGRSGAMVGVHAGLPASVLTA
jgi:hypothetical protein